MSYIPNIKRPLRTLRWFIALLAITLLTFTLNYLTPHKHQPTCDCTPPDSHANATDTPFALLSSPTQIRSGSCVCIHIVVPPASAYDPQYMPIDGWPADAILGDLVLTTPNDTLYNNARVTVPLNFRAINNDRDPRAVHIYEAHAIMHDPGEYVLHAVVEHRNGAWNAEPGQHTPQYISERVHRHISVHVQGDSMDTTHVANHMKLPLCTNGDARGRWIPKDNLPADWDVGPSAEDGRVWLPYTCRLHHIEYSTFAHLAGSRAPSIHWYGDSNSRRALRSFVEGGKWCSTNATRSRLDCLCNDAPRDLYPDEWYAAMRMPRWYRIHHDGVHSGEIVRDPKDLVPSGPFFDLYYLFTRGTLDMYGSYWMRDITHDRVAQYPRASLVVVQIVTWDAAFGTYAAFKRDIRSLALRLKRVYPHTRFVYRSGPYWCCRTSDDDAKKYSRLRFSAFDELARSVFVDVLGALVWDVMQLGETRPPEMKRYEENMPCRSAHSRAEIVHIENQIFMNMVLNQIEL